MAIETDDPNTDVSIDMNGVDGSTNNDKVVQQARKRKKVPFYKWTRWLFYFVYFFGDCKKSLLNHHIILCNLPRACFFALL